MATRRTRNYQQPLAHKKGTTWIETLKSPVIDGDGKVIGTVGFARDISDQKMLESERENARQAAENLARTKSDFLANMSHEIRTPLNGVLGLARIGYQESQGGDSQKMFGRILESGKLLQGVIDDILDFSKIEAGKLNVESVPIDVRNVIGQVIDLLRAQSDAKGLGLTMHASSDLPAMCLGDPVRLTQVILNLVSNAIKFTPRGNVTVSTFRDGADLVFSVADTGIGISDEQMGALFRPFEQADSSTTRMFGGTGLGLAITKRLVELMAGRIEIRSQPGCGSTFLVRLPFKPAPAGSAAAQQAATGSPVSPTRSKCLSGLRILAAEDGEINRLVLETLLHNDGAQVVMVTTGREAVELLKQDGAFDLVLMDIQMPEMDGYEASALIRVLSPELPIVGQTAHALAEDRDRCLAAGMCDYIAKPIDPDKLSETILRHARSRQTHGQN
jgi:signal transduction histidine kinase/CheY-like chemotaxis protein